MSYINPYKKFLFAPIPNWLIVRSEISQGAKLCYGVLIKRGGEKGYCWPSLETIGADLGVSASQAKKYIGELRKVSLVATEKRGMDKSNNYRFLAHIWMDDEDASPTRDRILSLTQDSGTVFCPTRDRIVSPELDSSEKTHKKENKRGKPPPDPNVKIFIDWWCQRYQVVVGQKYLVQGGKDGDAVKKLLSNYTLERVKEVAELLLHDNEQWFLEHIGRTIGALQNRWNKYAGQRQGVSAQEVPSVPVWHHPDAK